MYKKSSSSVIIISRLQKNVTVC